MSNYTNFFGFQKEPFPQTMDVEKLYMHPALERMAERFKYAVGVGMVNVITGDVGSGKSTSLRYACSSLHPSKFKVIPVIANTGGMIEILRQICVAFDIDAASNSITLLTRNINAAVKDIFGRKCVPVLVIDEAHLMRDQIFFQLHTLMQYEFNAERIMPLTLCGQASLLNRLQNVHALGLASRVVGRTKLEVLDLQNTKQYVQHHLKVAGITEDIYEEAAVIAVHQGSGGNMRKANNLARGALVAAASKKSKIVSAEHVRLAAETF